MTEIRPIVETTTVQVRDRTAWWRKALKAIGIRTGIYAYTLGEDIIERNEYVEGGQIVCDYPDPPRGPSTIIFRYDRDDLGGWVEGVCFDQGDAHYEQDSGALDWHMKDALEADATPGWYVCENFNMQYSRDYWGEDDSQAEWGVVRPATWRDFERLWGCTPRWIGWALKLGFNWRMPAEYPEP